MIKNSFLLLIINCLSTGNCDSVESCCNQPEGDNRF